MRKSLIVLLCFVGAFLFSCKSSGGGGGDNNTPTVDLNSTAPYSTIAISSFFKSDCLKDLSVAQGEYSGSIAIKISDPSCFVTPKNWTEQTLTDVPNNDVDALLKLKQNTYTFWIDTLTTIPPQYYSEPFVKYTYDLNANKDVFLNQRISEYSKITISIGSLFEGENANYRYFEGLSFTFKGAKYTQEVAQTIGDMITSTFGRESDIKDKRIFLSSEQDFNTAFTYICLHESLSIKTSDASGWTRATVKDTENDSKLFKCITNTCGKGNKLIGVTGYTKDPYNKTTFTIENVLNSKLDKTFIFRDCSDSKNVRVLYKRN